MRKLNLISLAVAAALVAPLAAHADAGDTTIGGVIYADFTSINTQSLGKDVDPNGIGTDVSRAYFVVTHQFDDIWSANLTTDFNFAKFSPSSTSTSTCVTSDPATTCTVTTTTATSLSSPQNQLFVKKAYVQGKFDDMLVFRIGSADMPWIPYAEGVYGYRFVEKTIIDREGFGNSADWGLNLNGGNSMWNYSISGVNGGGYKNPTRSKTIDWEGRLGVTPIDGLTLAAGFYTGDLGQDTEAKEAAAKAIPATPTTPAVAATPKNTATRTNFLAAWKGAGLNVGVEYFTAKNFSSGLIFTPSTKTDSENGYSVYGSYDIPDTAFGVYVRYDSVKPKKDTESSLKDTYYNGGFAWHANKNVTWAFGFKSDELKDDSVSPASPDTKVQEVGVWLQAKY
ncbi:MAG: carbohydrate porin [Gammaproteobacteria bacterium]